MVELTALIGATNVQQVQERGVITFYLRDMN